jgi:predicted transcriptional regulator
MARNNMWKFQRFNKALSKILTCFIIVHNTTSDKRGRKLYNFLSFQRQNQLIQAIFTNIRDTIKKELSSSVFFSVSLDTTYDISRKE